MRCPPRRGFVTIIALTLIILIGGTLAVLGSVLTSEVRRTGGVATETQLRQLLIAGAAAAHEHLDDADGKQSSVPLPSALVEQGGTLTLIAAKSGDDVKVAISAEFNRRRASQVVLFARDGQTWKLVSASLN